VAPCDVSSKGTSGQWLTTHPHWRVKNRNHTLRRSAAMAGRTLPAGVDGEI